MYSSPVLSTISILVLIYIAYHFFQPKHTCFNMVFHAPDVQGVSCTDESREGENESTKQYSSNNYVLKHNI